MPLFEYDIVSLRDKPTPRILDILNDFGRAGWELISVDNGIAYFKRPVIISSPNEAIYPGGISEREMPKEQ